jgi:hypothetical protein
MIDIGDRHAGTAGGALKLGGQPVSVELRLGHDANCAAVQHTTWMLLNILCRLEGAAARIRLNCPAGVDAVPRLSPLIGENGVLLDCLLAGVHAIGTPADGFVPVETASEGKASDLVIGIGFDFCPEAAFCAVGNGFCGGVFSRPIVAPGNMSNATIGPYIAASLAAGEIFRLVRLIDYRPERQLFLTALNYSHGEDPEWSDLDLSDELRSVLLVGVGAVGCALLHTLYPLSVAGTILIADNDAKGVDRTNLGRYSLFGTASVGKQKASEAAELLCAAKFQAIPHDGSFEHFFSPEQKPEIVLSAVDTNESRHALMEQYSPLFFSASTHNLRAELLRCGPPSVGACLACFNPLQQNRYSEEDIRALLNEKPEMIATLCEKLHLDAREAALWIREGKCSQTGERLIEELRTEDGSLPAFAVGFVSVLAGTLLASELLKTVAHFPDPLDEKRNRAVFQFQNPSAASNRAHFYSRDERCTACSQDNAGARIWKQRYERFGNANNR